MQRRLGLAAAGVLLFGCATSSSVDASAVDATREPTLDAARDIGTVDAGPSSPDSGPYLGDPPTCAPPTFDTSVFESECATGAVAPTLLAPSAYAFSAAFDGTQLALLTQRPDELAHFDHLLMRLGSIPLSGLDVVAFDCGFALAARQLRLFDHDLIEHGAHSDLEPDYSLLLWNGRRFASVYSPGRGLGASRLPEITIYSRDARVLNTSPVSGLSTVWGASAEHGLFVALTIGGPPSEAMSATDDDGATAWTAGPATPGAVTVFENQAGFFVFGPGYSAPSLQPYSAAGAPLGDPVLLATPLGMTWRDAFSLAAHGGDSLAAYTTAEADGTWTIRTSHIGSDGHPIGTPQRRVPGLVGVPATLTLIWAGYSYLVVWSATPPGVGGPAPVYAMRLCP